MDRISELPEPLKEKVLFALPTKDAIRMSLSSRHWQSVWNSGWNSLPVSRFDLEDSTFMDDSFRNRLPEHEGQKRVVQVSLEVSGERTRYSDVDQWIKMVTHYYVTELKLSMGKTFLFDMYRFPPATFDVGSLVELSLTNCMLDQALIQKDTIFCCLKSLRFWKVDFNGLVGELFRRCPLLESLDLTCCENMQDVGLCDVPHLKNVAVHIRSSYEHCTFKIEAPNLESLIYEEDRSLNPLDLEEVCCRNLKKLKLNHRGSWISNKYMEEVFCNFPFLEDLELVGKVFESENISSIKISSWLLTKLSIAGEIYADVKNIIIDAPNLVSYEHYSNHIPPSIWINSAKLEKHILCLSDSHINTKWVLDLRKYLCNFPPQVARSSELKLYSPNSTAATINLKMLRKKRVTPRPKVREVCLLIRNAPANGEVFIDGLLSSCQPRKIRVWLISGNVNYSFIKFVHKKLVNAEEKHN